MPDITTIDEYHDYRKRVAAFLEREGLKYLCGGHDESFFSWRACECCGDTLGGDRVDATGVHEDGSLIPFMICGDCAYYAEYGCLDDKTMWNIEHPEDQID